MAESPAETALAPPPPQPEPSAPTEVPAVETVFASATAFPSTIDIAKTGNHSDAPPTRDFAEMPSSFAHEPPFRPRRNPATRWMVAAIIFAVLAIGAITAVAEFGVPDWLPPGRGTFAEAAPDLVLDFPRNRQERRPLPNGSDFFNVSGSILNVGKERRAVPMLLIVLRDERNNIVYSLETASPKAVLAPGESETVNQAIIDAPVSARAAEIGWKPR